MPLPPPVPAPTDRDAATIAGTLCLMSCFVQHPHPLYAARIAHNLDALVASQRTSPEFRAVCERLAGRWRALHGDALRRCEGAPPIDARQLQ